MFMSIFVEGKPAGLAKPCGICMPGIFIWVCGDAEGDACGICMPGIFIWVCGEAEGDACGICIPGMFICICGEAEGEACGIFIPGMLPICFLFCAAGFFLRGVDLRIRIPGIFIPGILPIWCFLVDFFFLVAFLLFRGVAFELSFAFGLLIPGILDMSCPR